MIKDKLSFAYAILEGKISQERMFFALQELTTSFERNPSS
jgi:hypothetical protein